MTLNTTYIVKLHKPGDTMELTTHYGARLLVKLLSPAAHVAFISKGYSTEHLKYIEVECVDPKTKKGVFARRSIITLSFRGEEFWKDKIVSIEPYVETD